MESTTAIQLVRRAELARREGRLRDARRDLTQAVGLCREAGEPRALVRALKALGQIERDHGRADAARPLYEEAVAICREDGDPNTVAHTVRHLGDVHCEAGRLDLAEPCYLEALALYRGHEHPPPLDLANAIRSLAILKGEAGDGEEARLLWEEAKDLYTAADVGEGVAECSAWLTSLSR